MKWQKVGLIFSPAGLCSWMVSHAANPVVLQLDEHLYRIYFACRDAENRSHVGYIEIDPCSPREILRVSSEPALAPGPLGYFDDHGVYAASLVEHDGVLFMYYTGWNPGPYPMYYPSVGLAVSEDTGRTFRKMSKAPILARSEYDPWFVSQPFVLVDNGIWRMWYISGIGGKIVNGQLQSHYHTKYAESQDGVHWDRKGVVCIELLPGERNIARPCVIKEGGRYKMWYPRNSGHGYRIGYAESDDGFTWARMDNQAGIDVSPSGWDSEAVTYPWVFIYAGKKYMLYNGNGFGREGIGIAVEP